MLFMAVDVISTEFNNNNNNSDNSDEYRILKCKLYHAIKPSTFVKIKNKAEASYWTVDQTRRPPGGTE
jgi:hypothetical protein